MKRVRDLLPGDKVNMELSVVPFPYDDVMAEFEYGIVDEVACETDNCFVVYFENMTSMVVSPDCELVMEGDET